MTKKAGGRAVNKAAKPAAKRSRVQVEPEREEPPPKRPCQPPSLMTKILSSRKPISTTQVPAVMNLILNRSNSEDDRKGLVQRLLQFLEQQKRQNCRSSNLSCISKIVQCMDLNSDAVCELLIKACDVLQPKLFDKLVQDMTKEATGLEEEQSLLLCDCFVTIVSNHNCATVATHALLVWLTDQLKRHKRTVQPAVLLVEKLLKKNRVVINRQVINSLIATLVTLFDVDASKNDALSMLQLVASRDVEAVLTAMPHHAFKTVEPTIWRQFAAKLGGYCENTDQMALFLERGFFEYFSPPLSPDELAILAKMVTTIEKSGLPCVCDAILTNSGLVDELLKMLQNGAHVELASTVLSQAIKSTTQTHRIEAFFCKFVQTHFQPSCAVYSICGECWSQG